MKDFQGVSNFYCPDGTKLGGRLGSALENIFYRLLGRCIGDSPKDGDCPPLGGHKTALAVKGGYLRLSF